MPLTAARIAALPVREQLAWKDYLKRSEQQRKADRDFLRAELRKHGLKEIVAAPPGSAARSLPLDKPAAWYGSPEARRIADIIVSFQTPAGGWSKNLDFSRHKRAPGEGFAPDNASRFVSDGDFEAPESVRWNYIGTFDNGATTTQMRFLARVIAELKPAEAVPYHKAFMRGLDYIFSAQYPNGGWPQVWPLQGGYHDCITYNDGAMINILRLLRDVSQATNEFSFVPAKTRARAKASLKRGIECILATQIVVDGRRTIWGQQHDALTLQPASARNYEMPAQCAAESADILLFLIQQPEPWPELISAVHAAAAWFEKTKILEVAYAGRVSDGRELVPSPGSGPLWARYHEIGTDRPIFGDRDKSIHDDLKEISRERRIGYAWYTESPKLALEEYRFWSKAHPQSP